MPREVQVEHDEWNSDDSLSAVRNHVRQIASEQDWGEQTTSPLEGAEKGTDDGFDLTRDEWNESGCCNYESTRCCDMEDSEEEDD